ncbi:MAG: glutaredoxin family protein [Deltaproteobacteria bacterium]|nr:glutaredoxin family protein [Deltaproteobacteria bacterium]
MDVVFYTRKGCHLCEDAWVQVLTAQSQRPFAVRVVDIDEDRDAYDDFKFDIPVLEIDGQVAFKHRMSAAALVQVVQKVTP